MHSFLFFVCGGVSVFGDVLFVSPPCGTLGGGGGVNGNGMVWCGVEFHWGFDLLFVVLGMGMGIEKARGMALEMEMRIVFSGGNLT